MSVEPSKAEPRGYKKWCVTWNNPPLATEEEAVGILRRSKCTAGGFSLEKTDTSQLHWQGFLVFKSQKRMKTLLEIMPGAHLEPMRGSLDESLAYITKEPVLGPFLFGCALKRQIVTGLEGKELHAWQTLLIEKVREPPKSIQRVIHWVWSLHGSTGKSSLARHLAVNFNALYFYGKADDVKHAIRDWVAPVKGEGKPLDIVICDVPFTGYPFNSYTTLEQILNCILFSGKYESRSVMYPPVHLIVFANEAPDQSKMTEEGRWDVVNVDTEPLWGGVHSEALGGASSAPSSADAT